LKTIEQTKPSLAFAGVGWIGRSRLEAVARSGKAAITLISDPSQACIDEALKIAPQSSTSFSFEETIASKAVEGVVIATPSALHKEQAVAAFESGKSVFCQKPLGRSLKEVRAVVDAAKKAIACWVRISPIVTPMHFKRSAP
jgi:predicted dehydrogenase